MFLVFSELHRSLHEAGQIVQDSQPSERSDVINIGALLPADSAPLMLETAPVFEPLPVEYVQTAPVVEFVAPVP